MEQILYKLPDGWEWLNFDSLVENLDGKRIPIKTSERSKEKAIYPYYGATGIIDYVDDYIYEGEKLLISEDGANLVARKYPIAFLADGKYWVNNHAHVVDAYKDKISNKYLSYFFAVLDLSAFITGSAQPKLSQKKLNSIKIAVAPKAEQERIVEKLDSLLTRIDTAIEHLHSKLDLSKQLFDSLLDEFFKLPECDAVPLTEVVDFIGGSQPPKSQFSDIQKEGYVRLIQIRDYKSDNYIVYVDSASTKKFCTKDDVMIGRYGPPVFQILRGLDGAYNVALMKAVPNEDLLTKDYLFWFLQSPSIQNYVIGISQRAAGQSGVNKKALEKYLIPVPSKTVQNNIVDKVGQLVSKSCDLEAEVTAEIASLNQLKASILDSAFKGEL
ncbi:restriction endonuclease subunit S [Morganella morganii]|uniref:restriction endonuclease subunit S n=1 Tax=Morganella morganii TaxID=582 RepID=UPI0005378E67|nr:restriction endonuclease subunit S [Morganella morganii]AUT99612.1 hypothetical protein MC49_005240 [Morganella morganii]